VVFFLVTMKSLNTKRIGASDVDGSIECCGRAEKTRKAAHIGNVLKTRKPYAVSEVKNFHARHTTTRKKPFILNKFWTAGKN
jgi:hypothetical protein